VGGVWSFDQERKEPIAFVGRESVTDPDMFRRVERVMLDETGTIVFEGSKEPAPLGSFDIWHHEDGQTTPVVKRGELGLVGIGVPRLANGRVIFSGRDWRSDASLWASTAGGIAPIAMSRTDGPLGPNLGPDIRFAFLDAHNYQVTASGEALFYSKVTGDVEGIWRTSANGPQALALEGVSGHLGPNLGENAVFTAIWPDLGPEKGVDDFAFRAYFRRDTATEVGIFKNGANGNSLLALGATSGPLGPQLGPGITFASPNVTSINNRGDVLIGSNLSGAGKPQIGVWINSGNGNTPVALTLTDSDMALNWATASSFGAFHSTFNMSTNQARSYSED
jgi:hypothetical protein